MFEKVCRLCLRRENLIDIFECESKTTERLKTCILLATGIEIHKEDVSRCVCYTCIQVAIMLYKFRKNALANDKTLKEHINKQLKLPESLEDEDLSQNLLDLLQTSVKVSSFTQSSKSHSSSIQLINNRSDFEIPKEVLENKSISPVVFLNRVAIPQKLKPPDAIELNDSISQHSVFSSPNAEFPNSDENFGRNLIFRLSDEKGKTNQCSRSGNETPTGSLLEKVSEEPVFTCGYCNKMFKANKALKKHQLSYRFCCVCNGVFRNQAALSRHQQEICFKNLTANSPRVLLNHVDRDPEMLKFFPKLRQHQELKNPNLTNESKPSQRRNSLIKELIALAKQAEEEDSDSFQDLFTLDRVKEEPLSAHEGFSAEQIEKDLNKMDELKVEQIKYEESSVKEETISIDNSCTSEAKLKPGDVIAYVIDLFKNRARENRTQGYDRIKAGNLDAKKLRTG
ncbi:hypothetical protein Trydic_g11850 [Trypoxylus dichotomus]